MYDMCTSPGRAWGWAGHTGALEADADFSKPPPRYLLMSQNVKSKICTALNPEHSEEGNKVGEGYEAQV